MSRLLRHCRQRVRGRRSRLPGRPGPEHPLQRRAGNDRGAAGSGTQQAQRLLRTRLRLVACPDPERSGELGRHPEQQPVVGGGRDADRNDGGLAGQVRVVSGQPAQKVGWVG
jgi:hypothetical protein